MKHTSPRLPSSRRTPIKRRKRPVMPFSHRFLLVGHILILLSLCDFAARLHAGVSADPVLYIGEYFRSVSVSIVLVWAAGLGFDLWEKWGQ